MAKKRAALKLPEEKKNKCLEMLMEGKYTKREIANKLKINSGYVYRLASEANIGQLKNETGEDVINVEESIDTMSEYVEESEITETEKVGNVRGKLTQEDRIKIAIECEESKLTRKEIGKKYGVSGTTVSNIAKEMGIPPAKQNKPDPNDSTIEPINTSDITEVFKGAHVVCGLIAERHDIPVSEFIFDEALPPEKMHQYDWQYKTCVDFIDSHITFSKTNYKINAEESESASADLVVYMTGCQSAFGALIKACLDKHVNLTCMHYDTDIKDYHSQVIISHFRDENQTHSESYLASFLEQYSKAFFYKCSESDLINLDTIYIINKVNIGTNTTYDKYTKKGAIQQVYLCKNDGDAWELYPKLAKEILLNTNENLCLYLIPVDQDENGWQYNTAYAKTYNFKSEIGRR